MTIASGLPSIIKSIQFCSLAYSAGNGVGSITAVNTAKSVILPMGSNIGTSFIFTNSTTVTFATGAGSGTVYFQVIEYV